MTGIYQNSWQAVMNVLVALIIEVALLLVIVMLGATLLPVIQNITLAIIGALS